MVFHRILDFKTRLDFYPASIVFKGVPPNCSYFDPAFCGREISKFV